MEIYEFKFPKKMIFTKTDEACFNAADDCFICGQPLGTDIMFQIIATLMVSFAELV